MGDSRQPASGTRIKPQCRCISISEHQRITKPDCRFGVQRIGYPEPWGEFKPARVTHLFSLDSEYELPRTEAVHWKSADGTEVEGVLTYPLNYQKGKRYPLVSQIHGGPQSSDRLSFPFAAYTLAAMGYAVLKPNYRGSTGYGNEFLRDMVGHYFNNADKDVTSGIDYLIAQGIADPDKLVIMGWSAVGHMTNW